MKRSYSKGKAFDRKHLGFSIFTLFILYVAFRILTPPSKELATIDSPDGSKTARLRKIHYVSQPSYKVSYRQAGSHTWLNLYYLSSYTNVPHQTAREALEWSSDSEHLYLMINDQIVWYYTFR